ncbi:MAG: hypothetical protein GDA54_02410 [Alphaproteobacteria bacterium GM7ARS4]|nr:hypothetical protein [Alphaproteobacteria bacterium GM7ARS4]
MTICVEGGASLNVHRLDLIAWYRYNQLFAVLWMARGVMIDGGRSSVG